MASRMEGTDPDQSKVRTAMGKEAGDSVTVRLPKRLK